LRGLGNDILVYGQAGDTESLQSNLRQYKAIPFAGGLAAQCSAMRTQIGRGDVIKQSLGAMCGRTLHHKITLKLLLIGLRRGCLKKIIIFVVSLIFTLNSHHATPQHLPMSSTTTSRRKKDSVEKAEESRALEAS